MESYLIALIVFAVIGVIFSAKFVIQLLVEILIGIRVHFVSRISKRNLVKEYGKWAVVTGCTDGIGKAYMLELAKRGMNIILISRTLSKLEQCAQEVRDKYSVETEILQVDFTNGKDIYPKIKEALTAKEIGILVNNVGMMYDVPKPLLKATDDEIHNIITVNACSVASMMKIVLPSMLERRKGAIVNVCSLIAITPCPLMGIYAATKTFVDYISTATNFEYKTNSITIQTLLPSYVHTNMSEFFHKGGSVELGSMDAETYARRAVNTIGLTDYTTGHWWFGVQMWVLQSFNRSLLLPLIKYNVERKMK